MSLSPTRRAGNPTPLSERAADWALRQEQGPFSASDQQSFENWLAEDADHISAYEAAIWALDVSARYASSPALMAMREDALAARGEKPKRVWLWSGIGGAIAASLIGAWLYLVQPGGGPAPSATVADLSIDPRNAVYSTAVGERLAVTLPDGSVATLDTNSRVRVAYTSSEREIYLLRGQALFDVAHGRSAPFLVQAGGQIVTAVGTVFNVRLDGNRVRVALVEGVVRVRSVAALDSENSYASRPIAEITMRAGEMLEVNPARPILVRTAQVAQIASWRGGELVFNDVRLTEAVAELNRYTTRPIAIVDPAVGNHRVTGVFRSNDPERFSQAMSELFPIEVGHAQNGSPLLRERR